MRILVADDHSVFRAGMAPLTRELDPGAEVVEADSFKAALDLVDGNGNFDLILLDLMMPGMDAFEGLEALHKSVPTTPIVVVSMIESRQDVLHAIEVGAHGFIPKAAEPAEMVEALRAVLAGQVYLPPALLLKSGDSVVDQRAAMRPGNPAAAKRLSTLTARQREVVERLGQGKTNAQIATELGLSESTVRLHVSTILDKLNLSNRTQVALLAAQSGMVGLDDVTLGGDRTA